MSELKPAPGVSRRGILTTNAEYTDFTRALHVCSRAPRRVPAPPAHARTHTGPTARLARPLREDSACGAALAHRCVH